MECTFCQNNVQQVDYKKKEFLRKFVTSQYKISSSRRNNLCGMHQRKIANAIKNARYMALVPYTRNQLVKTKSLSSSG